MITANVSKPVILSDSIIFYSNELIKDKDVIVNVKDKYTITEWNLLIPKNMSISINNYKIIKLSWQVRLSTLPD